MISNIKDVWEDTYDLASDLIEDVSTLQKKVDTLNVEFDNINQYEHGDGLVISGDIIPHGTPTKICKDIVFDLFWRHLNMKLGEDELIMAHRIGEKPFNGIVNREIFLKPIRKQPTPRFFYATCELNSTFYVNYYLIHKELRLTTLFVS